MSSGRKPKPLAIKMLEGNRGKRKLPDIKQVTSKIPKMPNWLSPRAKKWWKVTVPVLHRLGIVVSPLDDAILEITATIYGIMMDAKDKLASDGMIVETPNACKQISPYHTIYRQNAALYKSFASSLGLNPEARQKLTSHVESELETDPIEAILNSM